MAAAALFAEEGVGFGFVDIEVQVDVDGWLLRAAVALMHY